MKKSILHLLTHSIVLLAMLHIGTSYNPTLSYFIEVEEDFNYNLPLKDIKYEISFNSAKNNTLSPETKSLQKNLLYIDQVFGDLYLPIFSPPPENQNSQF
jgi:hypothetical protein